MGYFIWVVFLMSMFAIGGFFMFRKFLKRLPKEDGMSELDWQDHYLSKTVHLWSADQKQLLNVLVEPVPELFRDVAKQKIAGKIGELAIEEQAASITEDLIVRGYILATPKRDHKFLLKTLKKQKIDAVPYQHLF